MNDLFEISGARLVADMFPLPFPVPQPASALVGGENTSTPAQTSAGGGAPVKILMGSEVIVDRPCVRQRPVERGGILDGMLQQDPLHRADEPLDAAVLPQAPRITVLQAIPQEALGQTKTLRG